VVDFLGKNKRGFYRFWVDSGGFWAVFKTFFGENAVGFGGFCVFFDDFHQI
jgi:hypothetical protein